MRHLESLHIKQFRGIRDLKLNGLGNVNLLVGVNNSGKTSVLEAVDLLAHPLDILEFVEVSKKRDSDAVSQPTLDSIRWMFPTGSETVGERFSGQSIEIVGKVAGEVNGVRIANTETEMMVKMTSMWPSAVAKILGDLVAGGYKSEDIDRVPFHERTIKVKAYLVEMQYFKDGEQELSKRESFHVNNTSAILQGDQHMSLFRSAFITPIDHRSLPMSSDAITETILAGNKKKTLELLRLFDQDIEDIEILAPQNNPVPYLTHKKIGRAPISIFGDGVRRALTLATAVVNTQNGALLIDEIETAVHVRALSKVFNWLIEACAQYNVQLFATTHSLEAIDAILQAFKKDAQEDQDEEQEHPYLKHLVAYRLEQQGNATHAKRFSGEDLNDFRYEFGLDVR